MEIGKFPLIRRRKILEGLSSLIYGGLISVYTAIPALFVENKPEKPRNVC